GSKHLILLGGVQFSNALTRWFEYQPDDPEQNLGAAWHVYNFNGCRGLECSSSAPSLLADKVPIVATEIGQDDCASDWIESLMTSFDTKALGYLAWWWNTSSAACVPGTSSDHGPPLALISDYYCPVPRTPYAEAFRDHLETLAH